MAPALAAAAPGLWQLLWLLLPAWGLVYYLRWLWLARLLRQRGSLVCGRIMACRSNRGTAYEVRFITHVGQLVQAWHEVTFSCEPMHATGDEIALRYDEQRPTRFLLEGELTTASLWVVAALAGLCEVVLLASSVPLLALFKQS